MSSTNQTKNLLVIVGHPQKESLCGALAQAYLKGAGEANYVLREIWLGELEFDPLLKFGYTRDQTLEPDLAGAQEDIAWADHLVFVYPTWWGTFPALLKGFVDRVFLPGFAFKYRKGSIRWDKLLLGKTARLMVTMDAPPWYFRFFSGQPGNNCMKKTVLEFCGVKPVKVTNFGSVKASKAKVREGWVAKARALGAAGA